MGEREPAVDGKALMHADGSDEVSPKDCVEGDEKPLAAAVHRRHCRENQRAGGREEECPREGEKEKTLTVNDKTSETMRSRGL